MDETSVTAGSISLCEAAAELNNLSDEDLLSHINWKSTAPGKLVGAWHLGDPQSASRQIRKRLRQAVAHGKHQRNYSILRDQLLWSRHAFEETPRTAELIDFLNQLINSIEESRTQKQKTGKQSKRQHPTEKLPDAFFAEWLQTVTHEEPVSPFELLILLELLMQFNTFLSTATFWNIWRVVFLASVILSNNSEEPAGSWPTPDQELLVQGELAWKAGHLFADIRGSGQFLKTGRNTLRAELCNSTDTDGTPQAELLQSLPFWLACFIRTSQCAQSLNNAWWDEVSQARFKDLVTMVTRMLKSDGYLPLGNGSAREVVSLLNFAAEFAGISKSSATVRLLNSVGKLMSPPAEVRDRHGKAQQSVSRKIKSSQLVLQSDWGELAHMRNNLEPRSDMITVTHQGQLPMIECTLLGQTIFSGEWRLDITIDGEPVAFTDNWFCTCWNSDKDADYFELQQDLADGLRVARQILLSRTDHLALFADVISGAGESRVDYSGMLPLAENINVETDVPTRECVLTLHKIHARLFPLALPQDRVLSTPGRFGRQGDHLELQQAALGGLYAPVLISWHPRRKRDYADWKKLTVTENGTLLNSAAASGHRLRLGSQQWLAYHNVNQSQFSRALLGCHTRNETLFAQFDTDGDIQPILLVE